MKFLSSALLLASIASAQITTYGGPQYGYNANQQITVFDMWAYGPPVQGGNLQYVSQDHGASFVFLVEGLTQAYISWPFGATQLVDSILSTNIATYISTAGGHWEFNRTIPNDPAIVGIQMFAQFAHFFPAHYVGTNGLRIVFQ